MRRYDRTPSQFDRLLLARDPLKKYLKGALRRSDALVAPAVYAAGRFLRAVRTTGVHNMPHSLAALRQAGVFPIRDHYFEPMFQTEPLRDRLSQPRKLPGFDWNEAGQLAFVSTLTYGGELGDIPFEQRDDHTFHFNNHSFESGDAEFLYNVIRVTKPARVVEVGSGNSTRMAARAIAKNRSESPEYVCDHVCIEPYEAAWLERTGVRVLRERVEDVDRAIFASLEANDLLFIDSSHMIRPFGDVLVLFLEILPTLRPGVVVHIHDIFSPRDYPAQWVIDEVRLWNEQYLLEAFLTHNAEWEILGALNFLHNEHYDALLAVCPYLTPSRLPGSFYMRRRTTEPHAGRAQTPGDG